MKRSARQIIERYYARLTLDFDSNKRVCDEVAVVPSKRVRNKIAGFVTVGGGGGGHWALLGGIGVPVCLLARVWCGLVARE